MHVYVVFLAILVSALAECPYERPQDPAMTCLMGMPRMDTGIRPNGGHPPHSGQDQPPPAAGQRRRRQAAEEDPVVVQQPPTMPLGVPEISDKHVNHFCSENGTKMVECISDVYEKCEGHPGLMEIHFNPEEAQKAQAMCKDHHREFKDSLVCLKDSSKSEGMQECALGIQAFVTDQNIPAEMISCSVTAEMYNCLVTNVGADCGKSTVGFLISIWRTMEPRYCTKMIDRQYIEPVSAGIQLQTSILSAILVLMVSIMI